MNKEELKQEAEVCMHNALFWLKLPISKENVEQGGSYILKLLEPREKRIEELEKENKVLAQNLEDTEIINKTYEKRFDDLKKENAELKKKNLDAKEIIKKLMVFAEIDNRKYEEAYKEAEQFLKEIK